MGDLFKGCPANIYFQKQSNNETLMKSDLSIIEDLSKGKRAISTTNSLQIAAYNSFMSAAYILLERKDIYSAVTEFFHGFSRRNEIINLSRSDVSFLIKNKMRDNLLPITDADSSCVHLEKYIKLCTDSFSLSSIQENLPDGSYYTISEMSVAQEISKQKKQTIEEFKAEHDRLTAKDELVSVWLSTSETKKKFTTVSFYTGLAMKPDGIPAYQAFAITVPGTVDDLRNILEKATTFSDSLPLSSNKINESFIIENHLTEESFTPEDLKVLNEDFIDNLDPDEVPTETVKAREQKDREDYDYAVGIAFDERVYDMKVVKERLLRVLDNMTYLTDYSEPVINSETYP
jgi:hypothetical protein